MTETITCTQGLRAYVPDAGDGVWDRYNLSRDAGLTLEEREPAPGSDGLPIFVDAGCGREIPLDPRQPWDVNVVNDHVVEEHLELACPACGSVTDHLTNALDAPEPLAAYQERKVDEALDQVYGKAYPADLPFDLKLNLYRGSHHLLEGRILPVVQGAADAGYSNFTEGAVALAAATAKTIIGGKSHANFGMSQHHVSVSFDGVTASAVPVLIEVLYCTWATNAPGTNSTSTTERQEYGRVLTAGATAGKTWSTEPTVLTAMSKELLLTPNGGAIVYDVPLGKEPDCALGEGFAVRCTAPAIVNVRASQKWRRC